MAEILRSSQPAEYLRMFTSTGARPDGRTADEIRSVLITRGNLGTTLGSSLVRLGDTAVICGVKAELAEPKAEAPKDGFIVPNVELGPLCSAQFRPGPPSAEAQQLTQLMHELLLRTSCLKLDHLCLIEGKFVWLLYVDLVCLNYDGNVTDACTAAMVAALHDTRLPSVSFPESSDLPSVDYEIMQPLQLEFLPLTASFAIFDGQLLADPTVDEEQVQSGAVCVVADDQQRCSVLKPGGASLPVQLEHVTHAALATMQLMRDAILHPETGSWKPND